MTVATYNMHDHADTDHFPWTPSGKLCLELIEAEIQRNGKFVYARENLSQVEFENFSRHVHFGWGEKI